jgi:hypothetical protein
VVVVGGLAWPNSTPPAANARPLASEAAVSPSPGAVNEGASQAHPGDGAGGALTADELAQDDPARALGAALDALKECADAGCAAEFFEDPSTTDPPSGAVDLPAAERTIALLDDLGGVAILSVAGADATVPAQLVVLVHVAERWVIRDVRDVEAP